MTSSACNGLGPGSQIRGRGDFSEEAGPLHGALAASCGQGDGRTLSHVSAFCPTEEPMATLAFPSLWSFYSRTAKRKAVEGDRRTDCKNDSGLE